MKAIAKRGYGIEVQISGYRDKPEIKVEPFSVGDKRHPGGTAYIQHWAHKGLDRGLFFEHPRSYIEMSKDGMNAIDTAISELSKKVEYIYKTTRTVTADGYELEKDVWHFDSIKMKIDGYTIYEPQMMNFLIEKGIDKIEVDNAIRLFGSEHDIDKLKRSRKESERRTNAAYRDDVAEAGEEQARRNWGMDCKYLS